MSERTILWAGASGTQYKYWILDMDASLKDQPGNYIFAREVSPGRWVPLYIGETDSLRRRLADHEKLPCVRRNGGTHIHAHTSSSDEDVRRAEESDLIKKWDPPCNQE